MIIMLDETHRLETRDRLNMELAELRKKKDGTPAWVGMGRYYQSLASALKAVYDMRVIASDFEGRPQGCDSRGARNRARASGREEGVAMRLYVIGSVTGREKLNRKAFDDAKGKLEQAGYDVLIPHDVITPDASHEQAMRLSLGWIATLDRGGVAMLDDWAKSPGATLENRVATACGLQVHCVDTWRRMAGDDPEDDNSPEEEQDQPSSDVSDALARRMDETNALLRAVYNQIAAVVALETGVLLKQLNWSTEALFDDTLDTAADCSTTAKTYYEAAGKENTDDREA